MSNKPETRTVATYVNPVYLKPFPDPFVIKFRGEYFAYATGYAADGHVFPILRSPDLVDWSELGGAMRPLADSLPYYWAPEVAYYNGKFYLYYSVGNETLMELRVAVSDRPDGGFVDAGVKLTDQDFAIDAHVFTDEDGSRYLFYATDFLDHTHIGTGTVVDRMTDWFKLSGEPRPVTRARFDWQVYDPARKEKGGVRWHTVEGPAVLKRKGNYYEMFSGGNWQDKSYGVSFAITDDISRPEEWKQFSDGVNVLPVLRTIPGIVGPGHNSVVRGPNNRELFCVYHRWIDNARVMSIDRMDFAGDRLFVMGATEPPQPVPFQPAVKERFLVSPGSVRVNGEWEFGPDCAISSPKGDAQLDFFAMGNTYYAELMLRCGANDKGGEFGAILGKGIEVVIDTEHENIQLRQPSGPLTVSALPSSIDCTSELLLRIEVDLRRVRVDINDVKAFDAVLAEPGESFSVFTRERSVMLTSVEITRGFVELFQGELSLADRGFIIEATGEHTISDGEVMFTAVETQRLLKGGSILDFETAVNLRLLEWGPTGEIGFSLEDADGEIFGLHVVPGAREIIARTSETSDRVALPAEIGLSQYHQLRIVKIGATLLCYFDDLKLGEYSIMAAEVRPVVVCRSATVAVEMFRVIEL